MQHVRVLGNVSGMNRICDVSGMSKLNGMGGMSKISDVWNE